MGRSKAAAARYYDRHAASYDQAYDSPYWRLVRRLIRREAQTLLGPRVAADVVDLGAGTGVWGVEFARAGHRATLVDISAAMLARAQDRAAALAVTERVTTQVADVCDLAALPDTGFDLAVAVGDVYSFCSDARRALRETARILRPGAGFVATVDNRAAGYEAHLERGDLGGLEALVERGESEWLAHRTDERFAAHAFDPDELRRLLEQTGFRVERVLGLTVLPLRAYQKLLEDPDLAKRLERLEERLHARPDLLGRASHLLAVARRS